MTNPVYFTVVGDFKAFIEDASSDADYNPQIVPVSATVTFTPIFNAGDVALATGATPRPIGYIPTPITAIIDPVDGRLKLRTTADAGASGATGGQYGFAPVRLLGTSPVLQLAGPLFYSVSFSEVTYANNRRGSITGFSFEAPNVDTELNLISVFRQPGVAPSGLTKIAPGAVRTVDGNKLQFSFSGVDIPNPVEVQLDSTGIGDSTTVGRDLITATDAADARAVIGAENSANKGQAGGYAPLNNSAQIDATFLPSYVDDVLSYSSQASFPATGETAKIYVATDTGDAFRWSGSGYVRISDRVTAAGITDSTSVGRAVVVAASFKAARSAIKIPTIYVEDYRDGVRTDNQIIDAAFADLQAGGEICFGQGVTYTLTSTVAPDLTAKPGVTINGQGATLTGSATTLFAPSGTVFASGSRPTVTAAITSRSKTITVNSTAALQAGDLVQIYSDAEVVDTETGTGGEVKLEMAQIRSVVNGTTIELEGRTWNNYSISGYTVKLQHMRPMRDITVKDLTLQSANRTDLGTIGIAAYYFVGLTYSNVRARGFTLTGMYCYGGFAAEYINCRATECSVEAWTDYGVGTIVNANGYGMWVQSVHGAKFVGCYGTRNRHTIDSHASRDVLMLGCTSEHDKSSSFSTHGSDTFKIINCTSRESGGGIVVRGTNNTIIGNTILGMIIDSDSGGQSYNEGIIVGFYTTSPESNRTGYCANNLIIANNYIDLSGYTTPTSATGGSGIRLGAPLRNARISNNVIKGFTQHAINARGIGGAGVDISNNLIDVSGQQTQISDGSTNRSAILLNPTASDATIIHTDVNIVNNLVTGGVPQYIVYMYGASSATYVSKNVRIIGNRSAQTPTSSAIYLGGYWGTGVEVWGNEPTSTAIGWDNANRFASPIITNPVSTAAPLATTTEIAAGTIQLGHASDTTLSRSSAGVLAVEGVVVPTTTSTNTLENKSIALGSNTLTGTTAQFNTALTDGDFATLAGTEALTFKTLTSPKINSILDTNGATSLVINARASAVNYMTVYNEAAGTPPSLVMTGTDTDIGLDLAPKGAGSVAVYAPSGQSTSNLVARGAATNVNLNFAAKGTGTVQANGVAIATNSTTSTHTVQQIELGHASDTTLTRSAAGKLAVEGVDVLLTGGDLGTPSSATLTNATGLPVSGITSSTSTALGVGSVELGHASDTTISRSSAGVIAVEGVTVPVNSITNTHTAQQIELGHASDTTLSRSAAGKLAVEGVDVLLNGGALGTPLTGTLTNCTSLPVSGIAASTSTALGVGSVELGHATDTTLSRSAAGTLAVEGVNVVLTTDSRLSDARTPTAAGQVADLSIVAFGPNTTRAAASYGDFPFGIRLSRAITVSEMYFRCSTADASGDLVVELRKNGTIIGSATTIAAASQLTGGGQTGLSLSFSAGDILTVYIATGGVGTTPGKGLIADIKAITA